MKQKCLAVVCLFMLLATAWPINAGTNWPGWRGPEGSGVSDEKNLPAEWSPTKNIQWKTAISGNGHSSPIVWGNRIFLTTAIEGAVNPNPTKPKHIQGDGRPYPEHPDWYGIDHHYALKIICLDAASGKIVWEQTAYEGPMADYRHRKNTYASATPVTDGKLVFVSFGSEGFYAYDFKGKLVWKADLGKLFTFGMGYGTAPTLYEDLLIVQCDQNDGQDSFIAALNKNTGKEVWRKKRDHRISWAPPRIVKYGNHTELIASGNKSVVSYDPRTGEEIWRAPGVEAHAIPSILVSGDVVILSAGSNGHKRALAIKLGGKGDLTGTANILWTYNRGTAYVPSPILYGEYVYFMDDRGLLTCLEVKTGKVIYVGARVPVPATFFASPVAFDGKILLTSEDGDTFVIQAGAEHKVLGTNSLDEPIYASPALANGKIYIRSEKNLFCIGKK